MFAGQLLLGVVFSCEMFLSSVASNELAIKLAMILNQKNMDMSDEG